jgi:hypothetical protein
MLGRRFGFGVTRQLSRGGLAALYGVTRLFVRYCTVRSRQSRREAN